MGAFLRFFRIRPAFNILQKANMINARWSRVFMTILPMFIILLMAGSPVYGQTTINSITRTASNPNDGSISLTWDITFGASVTGLTSVNFLSPTTGTMGVGTLVVGGSGAAWTVTTTITPSTDGTVGLNLDHDIGLTPVISTPLPYVGEVYTIDITAPINQNTVFASSVVQQGGSTVTIVSSGDVTNDVWFAPTGISTFIASATMTKAANGTATSILAPADEGTYYVYVIDAAGNVSSESTATLTVDNTAPTNQNTVFASSVIQQGGSTVSIVSSADATNDVWFAPTGTTTFTAGATMTKAVSGTATSILAPATAGTYYLYVIDAVGNISAESTATLTVDNTAPTNQNTVFASSVTQQGGSAVSIVSSADATNDVWFAPTGTTTFTAGATMTKAASGIATSILAPATAGTYYLFVIDAAGNISSESTATLTVDNTDPIADITYDDIDGIVKSGDVIRITATFNEPVADAPIMQVALSAPNAVSLTNMTKTSTTVYYYDHTVTGGNGTVTVSLGTGTDVAGNTITSAPNSGATFTVDNTDPFADITYDDVDGIVKSGDVIRITATFNEPIADAPIMQVALSAPNAVALTNMTKTSATVYYYDHTVTAGDGTVTVSLGTGTDLAGNTITATPNSGETFTVDNTAPIADITYDDVDGIVKSGDVIRITATINDPVADAPVLQIALSAPNAVALTNMSKTSTTIYYYDHTVTAGDGAVTVSLGTGTDVAGNTITTVPNSGTTFTVDNTAPTNQNVVFCIICNSARRISCVYCQFR